NTIETLIFPAVPATPFTISFNNGTITSTTGNITSAGSSALDAPTIQNALNSLTSVTSVGGSVTVDELTGVPYGFLVRFAGTFAGKEQRLLTTNAAGATAAYLSRGGGSLIEDVVNQHPNFTSVMNVVKVGAGTLTLAGNNTYKGSTTVNQGVIKILSNNALGQQIGVGSGGTVVNAGGELQIGASVSVD